jgi:hypothetical protein
MSDTGVFSCDEPDFILRHDSKRLEYKGKASYYLLLENIEIFDKVLIWNTSCSTNWPCYGLSAALPWLQPAWCSVAYCACGVPL